MTASNPVLIIGGGIGGLAAALALARSGREVRLLEQAPEFVEIGAGLQVGPNATRVLDRFGLLDQVLDIAVLPEHGVMLDAMTGQRLTTLDLGPQFRTRYGYPYIVLHRSDLLSILLDACRASSSVTLENNKTVVDVWASVEGAGVECADGTRYRTELLLGADGINSRVRRLIDPAPARNSGYVAYRGTLPMSEVQAEVAENDVVLWIGPGMHLMQYPVRRHELYNQVAVFRSDRFVRGEEPFGTVEELRERFAPACAQVQGHLARLSMDRNWPIFDREPMDNWIAGRALLIGDAAHPMLQYLGQGACQALEDAYVLAQELTANGGDVDKSLAAYQSRRLSQTSRCQLTARPWGEVWHTGDPVTRALRDRLLRSRRDDDYSELDWLYLDQEQAS